MAWAVCDELYSPEIVYIGLLHKLSSADPIDTNKPMAALAALATVVIQEKRKIVLDSNGVRISKSLYIPFDAMDHDMLASLNSMVKEHKNYKMSCSCHSNNTSYEILLDNAVEVMGVSTILCAVLLLLRAVYGRMTETAEIVFDIILHQTMNNFRVDYSTTLTACTAYGYCPPSMTTQTASSSTL